MKAWGVFIVLFILSYGCSFMFKSSMNEENIEVSLKINVEGEVTKPGQYEVTEGTMEELFNQIELTENADCGCVNMERVLYDGDRLFIPSVLENKVSLNQATIEELQTIKGIGQAKANKMIEYRQMTPFQSIEDIMNISGVGEKTYLKWRPFLCL